MITMNGNGQGDARARLNVPVHGWAPGLRWPMQNRRICTVAELPELGWAADQIGRVGVRAGLRPGPLLRGDGIPADRVHVIPPGYDPVLFAAAAAADPFPGLPRRRVAYLGRLVPQKDVGTLLGAFAQLAAGAAAGSRRRAGPAGAAAPRAAVRQPGAFRRLRAAHPGPGGAAARGHARATQPV
jgi:hypothetical protein